MNRRRFLGSAGAVALVTSASVASGLRARGRGPSLKIAGAAPLPTAASLPLATPPSDHFTYHAQQIAADRDPASVAVSISRVFQGGALLLGVSNALAATASILGRNYTLQADGPRLASMIGFGVDDPPGNAQLSVALTDLASQKLTYSYPITVLQTHWTREEIDIPPPPPPDPNAPPPPPPPPDETPLLPVIYGKVTPKMWSGKWAAPLADMSYITSYFGEERSYNGGPYTGHHGGTDIGVPQGTPIHTTQNGTVVMSGLYLTRGNFVIVDHGAGVMTGYAHMVERIAQVGDVVRQGDLLGYVGMTGLATGPHLHWEISVEGVLGDALRWLDGSQGF